MESHPIDMRLKPAKNGVCPQFFGMGKAVVLLSGGVDSSLLRAIDRAKDQSYVLYSLGQEELKHLLLPLGDHRKDGLLPGGRGFGGGIIESSS